MGRKINEVFLSEYIELDRDCCEKFGINTGGVTEYINRLNNARFAPGRDDVLPRLVRYRNIRNKIAHELSALRKLEEITKADVKWIRAFDKNVVKKKDPISLYLRKARKYMRRRRFRFWFSAIFFTVLGALAAIICFLIFGY